jgi:cystathionine beta-synthase
MIVDRLSDLVGKTPILRIYPLGNGAELFLKLEKYNPGQSIKDRVAKQMLNAAEESGQLRPGGVVIESSSGNTGISLAMYAAERGYRFICVIDNHVPREKVSTLRALGAQIEHVGAHLPPDYHAAAERLIKVEELKSLYPTAFFTSQGDNPENPKAHRDGTAMELLDELGSFDEFVTSIGTGGTASGVGRRLKEILKGVIITGVEPDGSIIFGNPYHPFYQSGSGTARIIFANTDLSVIDNGMQVTDTQAFAACRFMASRYGLLVGGSSGSVIWAVAQRVLADPTPRRIVGIMGDGGERYIDTIFNDEWMNEQDLIDPDCETFIESVFPRHLTVPRENSLPQCYVLQRDQVLRGGATLS